MERSRRHIPVPVTKRTSRTQRSAAATPFQVQCLCGDKVDGLRRDEFQVLTCPSCHHSIFVLAQSPLPSPRPNSAPDSPVPTKSSPMRRQRSARARVRLARRRWRRFSGRILSVRRFFTLPILVGMTVLVVTLCTFLWQWKQNARRQIAADAARLGRAGLAALVNGDLVDAQKDLSRSAELLRRIESPLENERVYLQAAQETELVASLPGKSLQQILREAADSGESAEVLHERSLLFDGELAVDDEGRALPIPVGFVGDEAVVLDVASLPMFKNTNHTGALRILFGVKMRSLTRYEQGWKLDVDPSSAAWMTHPALLDYLGLSDVETKTTANEQRDRLGLPPW